MGASTTLASSSSRGKNGRVSFSKVRGEEAVSTTLASSSSPGKNGRVSFPKVPGEEAVSTTLASSSSPGARHPGRSEEELPEQGHTRPRGKSVSDWYATADVEDIEYSSADDDGEKTWPLGPSGHPLGRRSPRKPTLTDWLLDGKRRPS